MAILASESFQKAMQAPVKVLGVSITTNEDTPQTFTDADVLTSLSMESSGSYFGATVSTASFSLLGTGYSLVNVRIKPSLKVLTDSVKNAWETIDYGEFAIVEQTVDLEKEMTTFKCQNLMGLAAKREYLKDDLTFPCTVTEMVTQIAKKFGWTVATDIKQLPNAGYTIAEDLYAKINNTTYRDILAEVAGATATIAIFNGNSVLELRSPQMKAAETWTYDNLKKIKFEPKFGPVNTVTLSRTPQEDNITVKDEEASQKDGIIEIKLANNEILDDDRQNLAKPILDAVDGFYFYPFEATTEGHGWHEPGDRITVTDGVNNWDVIITNVKLTLDGGIKEVIKGVAPTATATDYKRAGGIIKTIYNTEIKVDKQNQTIENVVSEMKQLGDKTSTNYTQIFQTIENITNTIQTTGGANMLYNSVGYATNEKGVPTVWTCKGGVTSHSSPESLTFGAKSGNQINLAPGASISQSVIVTADEPISLSFRAKKGTVGVATVTISAGENDNQTVTLEDQKSYLWIEGKIEGYKPSSPNVTVTITVDKATTDGIAITDLMLASGDRTIVWEQASGEILNSNVLIDKDGIVVKNNVYAGDYVKITPLEFAGYSSATGSQQKVFTVNRDVTQVQKLQAINQISMPPIKVIPLTDSQREGWAFVKGDK